MSCLQELVVRLSPEAQDDGCGTSGDLRAQMPHLLLQSEVQSELVRLQIAKFLQEEDPLDEDGYPTERTLWALEHWPWRDPQGWFAFLRQVWHLASWGWHEALEPAEYPRSSAPGAVARRYRLSTAGWSGNESLIRAMQRNEMLWDTTWVESRRGGHHLFEIETAADDAQASCEAEAAHKPATPAA